MSIVTKDNDFQERLLRELSWMWSCGKGSGLQSTGTEFNSRRSLFLDVEKGSLIIQCYKKMKVNKLPKCFHERKSGLVVKVPDYKVRYYGHLQSLSKVLGQMPQIHISYPKVIPPRPLFNVGLY